MEYKTEVNGIYKVGEGVLINKYNDCLKAYKARKEKEEKIKELEKDLKSIKSDMEMIKELLRGLAK